MEVTKDTWLLQFINGPASVCWGVPDDPTQKLHHLHLYSIPSQLAGAPSDRSLREALLGEISAIGPLQRYRNRSSIGVMRGIGSRWCNTGECRLEVDIEGVLMSRREGLVHFSSQKLLSTLPGNEDCCPFTSCCGCGSSQGHLAPGWRIQAICGCSLTPTENLVDLWGIGGMSLSQKLHHLHLYSFPSQLAGAPSDPSLWEALLGEISAIGPLQRYHNRLNSYLEPPGTTTHSFSKEATSRA
ncbi:uncharacterized protein LOC119922700 isoform X2 [Tachyglossus aculeatus]|uniref:uncharacterized protein LOC119922700 isoform X2 n=1 Tax=Tachyglossus aculeatus TaxID=9261 RepID=UPI0018F5B2A4|nr:uncharacterized protein LOC119922700 isoform X2 [Tachyglossus aculeatus]